MPLTTSVIPSLFLVPTGIGCSVGGYAGDAIPAARLLAAASGCLITHPNVMNGATLYWHDKRIQYVEGLAIDLFTAGEIILNPIHQQKIGILFDRGIELELIQRHRQVIDACRATLGLNIGPIVTTDEDLNVSLVKGTSGSSWGEVGEPASLLRAGEQLKQAGATAIAMVTRFPDCLQNYELDDYRKGRGVDVLSGAEAVISHLLVDHLRIPCAHAPALSVLPFKEDINPLAAAEELGHTFLPCVLVGLSRAPDLLDAKTVRENYKSYRNCLSIDQLGAVIAPEGALGGPSVLACIERNIPLIAVSNKSVLNVNREALDLDKYFVEENQRLSIFHARNYTEAAGALIALMEGIDISTLDRPLQDISQLI